jgi:uncharacterized RDD family membrane protein YckC
VPAAAREPLEEVSDNRAAWGYRVGAWVIDASAAVALGLLIGLALKQGDTPADTVDAVTGLSILAGWVLVTAGMSAVTDGQTLGKWIAAVRVVRDARPAGFWWILLRDSACGVLFAIPLVFLINALAPLGSERRSLIDRMVKTDVVVTERIRGRVPAIFAAAVLGIGAWVGLAAAPGEDFSSHYTREEFVADCTDGGAGNLTCGCIYDGLQQDLSRDDLDEMRTAPKASDVSADADASLSRAVDVCSR